MCHSTDHYDSVPLKIALHFSKQTEIGLARKVRNAMRTWTVVRVTNFLMQDVYKTQMTGLKQGKH